MRFHLQLVVAAAALLSFYPPALLWSLRGRLGGGLGGVALVNSTLQQLLLALAPCALMYAWEASLRRRFLERPAARKKLE